MSRFSGRNKWIDDGKRHSLYYASVYDCWIIATNTPQMTRQGLPPNWVVFRCG